MRKHTLEHTQKRTLRLMVGMWHWCSFKNSQLHNWHDWLERLHLWTLCHRVVYKAKSYPHRPLNSPWPPARRVLLSLSSSYKSRQAERYPQHQLEGHTLPLLTAAQTHPEDSLLSNCCPDSGKCSDPPRLSLGSSHKPETALPVCSLQGLTAGARRDLHCLNLQDTDTRKYWILKFTLRGSVMCRFFNRVINHVNYVF